MPRGSLCPGFNGSSARCPLSLPCLMHQSAAKRFSFVNVLPSDDTLQTGIGCSSVRWRLICLRPSKLWVRDCCTRPPVEVRSKGANLGRKSDFRPKFAPNNGAKENGGRMVDVWLSHMTSTPHFPLCHTPKKGCLVSPLDLGFVALNFPPPTPSITITCVM
jgi:hypothetical protein